MEFSRQEYWSGLPFPSPGDLPDTGIEHGSPALQADSLPAELPRKPFHTLNSVNCFCSNPLLSNLKDRICKDLKEAEETKKMWQEYTEE